MRGNSQGFTLIEMLIALLVLSVGLLGLASLQSNGLRMNDSAYFRTQAVTLGYDMLDRMRGNSLQAVAGNYTTQADGTATGPGAMAVADVAQWQALIGRLLPGNVDGIVVCATPPPTICTVTVGWDDSRAGAAAQSIILRTQL